MPQLKKMPYPIYNGS